MASRVMKHYTTHRRGFSQSETVTLRLVQHVTHEEAAKEGIHYVKGFDRAVVALWEDGTLITTGIIEAKHSWMGVS